MLYIMDKILSSIEEEENSCESVPLEQIINMNPSVFTLLNPMTFIMYLDYNPNLSTDAREVVVKIIKKLNEKQNKINEINLKKFEEQETIPLENTLTENK